MSKVYNFSAGPSKLPEAVLSRVQAELLDYHGLGMSVMEMSHRSKEYGELAARATQDLRDLLKVPDNYQVLFMHGGGRGMFANVPMNLASANATADYVVTGAWSNYAETEARKYTSVNNISASQVNADGNTYIDYDLIQSKLNPSAEYTYCCLNETIHGIEYFKRPQTSNILIADASSDILSRTMDVSKYGAIFAGAQKNIGPSGFTIMIIRNDLLGHAQSITPSICDFKITADHGSMYNTPNTFAWYVAGLVFQWIKHDIGGVEKMEELNKAKSKKLYGFLDSSSFYVNKVDPSCRSRMNVVFNLKNDTLNDKFLAEAKAHNLSGLKGHRVLGGMRASIYNAMGMDGVDALIKFMDQFASANK